MTPLEVASKALYEHDNGKEWDAVHELMQGRVTRAMRAALLALADADIFMEHSGAGAAELNADPTFNDQINAESAFKAILRAIATEGNPDV
jgi:hypothetical protein